MKLYRVKLTPEERAHLLELLSKGKAAARTLTHARILLKADEGVAGPRLSDEAIAEILDVNRSTVERVRIRCVEEGFEAALRPRPSRQVHPRKLDGVQEAHLVTLACSPAPNGRGRWTLRLLADKLVELEIVDGISHETVRQTLKKTGLANFAGVWPGLCGTRSTPLLGGADPWLAHIHSPHPTVRGHCSRKDGRASTAVARSGLAIGRSARF
ncbi:MAG: helix-turn-helix domain-containing protein [Actinobacteria bacterium]|nr:helix-turn-helix domain-containing protein [Actinomycetota bacterium]